MSYVARGIIPDLDLLDGSGQKLASRDWVQPGNGSGYTAGNVDVPIYTSNRNSDNDRHIIEITDLYRLVPFAATSLLYSTSMIIYQGNHLARLQIIDLSPLQAGSKIHLARPFIAREHQDFVIDFRTKANAAGQYDNIELVGTVIEPEGTNIA